MNKCNEFVQQQRKIGATRFSVSGIYNFRGVAAVPYESTLERDFLIRTEFFLDVLHVVPQPIQIPFTIATGRSYTYTPDFLVTYRLTRQACRKPELVEVKPTHQWRNNWRKWQWKWKAAIRLAKERGWLFHILDESRIRDTVLKNIRSLERYKRMRFTPKDSERIIGTLKSAGPRSIASLIDLHPIDTDRSQSTAHLWHLVSVRQLDCNMHGPLNRNTRLWVPNHG